MSVYTELDLRKMKGQALKDTWHSMIGKPAGLKNTTGLSNSEEILQAILKGQSDPEFVKQFGTRVKPSEQTQEVDMPPKAKVKDTERVKPGPKPKAVSAKKSLAVESTELPQTISIVHRIRVHKLVVDDEVYFLDASTQKVYTAVDNRPGPFLGIWNPETRSVEPQEDS